MTTTTTYSPGDRVRVAHAPQSIFQGRTGTVEETGLDSTFPIGLRVDRAAQSIGLVGFRADELEPLPALHDALTEAERTGGMVQITGPDWRGTFGPLQDPADIPDDPDRPVGEVIDVVPGALVRQPAGSRRPDPAVAPSSSQAGLAALIPLRETVPPEAARDVMAGAGIDLDVFDAALARAREAAEEDADRPALAAYDDGHAQGHRDGLIAALRIVERFERVADDQPDYAGAALLGDVRDAIRAEVQA